MADEKDRKREPSRDELAWQQKRDKATAEYNRRKAEREERRAANTDDPVRAAAARRAAEIYRARIPAADNGAPVPGAGGKPGGGNGVPAAGGGNAENAALQVEVANLRNEVQSLRNELAAFKNRQTYTIKFGDKLGDDEEGGGKEYIAGDDTNIVFNSVTDSNDPDVGKVKVDVYYI